MESVKYILGSSEYIKGVGDIHPIKLKNYDTFMNVAGVLQISEQALPEELKDEGLTLFDFVMIHAMQNQDLLMNMKKLLSLVAKKEFEFVSNDKQVGLISDDGESILVSANYNDFRKLVMKQNLIYEKKIYKDKLVQEWADRVLEARRKSSIKMSIEDMITTVHAYTGISFNELSEYTLYQLNSVFNRITKIKNYDVGISMKCAGAEKVQIEHFAEELNLFKNPYEDVFKDSSKNSNLNKALGSSS